MNIAIVDDLKIDREHLCSLLKLFFKKYDFSLSIKMFERATDFINTFESDLYDLCFMDIYMDDMNGMDASRILYNKDPHCIIIFLTTSTDYAMQGYDVRAWRYLLKPITLSTLSDALPECVERILQNQRRLIVTFERQKLELPFSQIQYVTLENRNIRIVTSSKTIGLSSHHSFSKTVAPLLTDYRFINCCQGIVVNMDYVKEIIKESFSMVDGSLIPISYRKLKDVQTAYLNYSFESF